MIKMVIRASRMDIIEAAEKINREASLETNAGCNFSVDLPFNNGQSEL